MRNKILLIGQHQVKFNYKDKNFSYTINGCSKQEDVLNEIQKINEDDDFKLAYEYYKLIVGLNKDENKMEYIQKKIDKIPKNIFYDE